MPHESLQGTGHGHEHVRRHCFFLLVLVLSDRSVYLGCAVHVADNHPGPPSPSNRTDELTSPYVHCDAWKWSASEAPPTFPLSSIPTKSNHLHACMHCVYPPAPSGNILPVHVLSMLHIFMNGWGSDKNDVSMHASCS